MKGFRDLKVWEKSMDLVVEIYKMTEAFSAKEQYALTLQMRRASISIPSNIAEGSSRKNPKEFVQFLYISKGSLAELETQIEIAYRLSYLEDIDDLLQRIKLIRIMINKLIRAIWKD